LRRRSNVLTSAARRAKLDPPPMRLRPLQIIIILGFVSASRLQAKYMIPEITNVPITRLFANLQQRWPRTRMIFRSRISLPGCTRWPTQRTLSSAGEKEGTHSFLLLSRLRYGRAANGQPSAQSTIAPSRSGTSHQRNPALRARNRALKKSTNVDEQRWIILPKSSDGLGAWTKPDAGAMPFRLIERH